MFNPEPTLFQTHLFNKILLCVHKWTLVIVAWHLGTFVFWYLDTLVPWYPGTLVPWYLGTFAPCHWGTLVPRYLGTKVPRYLDTLVPWYLGALIPWHLLLTLRAQVAQGKHVARSDVLVLRVQDEEAALSIRWNPHPHRLPLGSVLSLGACIVLFRAQVVKGKHTACSDVLVLHVQDEAADHSIHWNPHPHRLPLGSVLSLGFCIAVGCLHCACPWASALSLCAYIVIGCLSWVSVLSLGVGIVLGCLCSPWVSVLYLGACIVLVHLYRGSVSVRSWAHSHQAPGWP